MNGTQLALLQHRMAVEDDQAAFVEIVKLFERKLKRFALSICHSREDAEEIVEDVFVRIWEKRKAIDQINNLRLYLFLATRNNALNYLRAKRGKGQLNVDDMIAGLETSYPTPEQSLITHEFFKHFAAAVEALPTRCKVIFKLIKEDGLKQKEVAELLDLSPKTIENQLAIAVKRLAKVAKEIDNAAGGKGGGTVRPIVQVKNILFPLWGILQF